MYNCLVMIYAPVLCNHCPPRHLRGIAGTTTFHPNSPAKSPVLRGPAESHSPALYKSKFLGVYLRNITSPALTRYCGGTQKVIAPHISPAIPVDGGGGGQGLQMTGALKAAKISCNRFPRFKLKICKITVRAFTLELNG